MNNTTRIVFDIEKRRPACVLLQAAYNADMSVAHRFPSETWLTHPTEGMQLLEATEAQIEKLVEITEGV